ncbi:MAG: hypothetical protein KZY61_09385, partial [Clostridiaceae bacterium]|nr:hypothetical protein [Clostridiaceae bacterium]MBW4858487.1 hypothetical protein [Clostridiaceae bacterium]MBW4868860.1 hypothetical protein [Clostridiaceae bacterium]
MEILSQGFSIDGGPTWNSWVSPYNISIVAINTTITILIRGTVSEIVIRIVRNITNIGSDTLVLNLTNNDTRVEMEVKTAKLEVVKYVRGDNSIEETIESNNAITSVTPTGFKQLSKEEYVKISAQKPDAEEILNTLVDIEIINTKVIKTPVSTSLEGQKLTGFKLIVEGMLNQKVEYIAC